MNKKILSLIAIALMAVVPFKVSAETVSTEDGVCTLHKDYFLFHDYFSTNDIGATESSKTFNTSNVATAEYKGKYISKGAKLIDGSLISGLNFNNETVGSELKIVDSNTVGTTQFKLSKYNSVWFDIIRQNDDGPNNNNVYNYSISESEKTYYVHGRYDSDNGDTYVASRPFWWYNNDYYFTNLSDSEKNQLESDILNSYLLKGSSSIKLTGVTDTKLTFQVDRTYTGTHGDLSNCVDMAVYWTAATGKSYGSDIYNYCVIPNIYEIQYYYPSECTGGSTETTEYTITYHSNNGSDTTKSYSLNSGSSHSIIENPFTREGYTFIGWSTNQNATQADSNYDAGDKYAANKNLDLYAVWVKNSGETGTTDTSKNGLGYSIGIIGTILAATGGGVVYFKKRNKFENI